MRKLTLLLALAGLLLFPAVQSQTPGTKGDGSVFFSETFNWGNPNDAKGWTAPEGFYMYDPTDNGFNFEWMSSDSIIDGHWVREPAMQSTTADDGYLILFLSRYNLPNPDNLKVVDNGVVFPAMDCSAHSSVVVRYQTCLMSYNNAIDYDMWLEVSVDNWVHAAVFDASFRSNWKERPLGNPPGVPAYFQCNISEVAAGQPNVKMRLHWKRGVLYFWEVDDLTVSEAYNNDLMMYYAQMEWDDGNDETLLIPCYMMPKSQLVGNSITRFQSSAINFGELDQEDAYFEVDITKNNQSVFHAEGPHKDIYAVAIDTTTITEKYTPTEFGHYKVVYNWKTSETDQKPENNSKTEYFHVTDSVMSYADDTSEEQYNWGAYHTDNTPLLDQVFSIRYPIYTDCEMNSVSIYIAGGLADGKIDFHACVYKEDPAKVELPHVLLTSTQRDYDSTMIGVWQTLELDKDGEAEFLKAGDVVYVGFEYNNMHTEYLTQRYDNIKPGNDKSRKVISDLITFSNNGIITYIRENPDGWTAHHTRNLLFRLNINDHSNLIDGVDMTPTSAWVGQNYPNPSTGSTVIDYELPAVSQVSFSVMDLTGRKVMDINQGLMPAGKHTYTLQTGNMEAGMYFYTLQAGSFTQTKQMVVN
ncbi:MAG: T9SS type A sorting domain-containing protein [Bacteroidota bacterium]